MFVEIACGGVVIYVYLRDVALRIQITYHGMEEYYTSDLTH